MKINTASGSLTLPCGFVLHDKLKMEEFRASGLCAKENIFDCGTPWYRHRFCDGEFQECPLGFVVCFYENPASRESALIDCSLFASHSFDPAKYNSCEDWNIEKDVQELEQNRLLMKDLLGKPHDFKANPSQNAKYPILDTYAFYEFGWGKVWCGDYDIKSDMLNSEVSLKYSHNAKWSSENYKQYLVSEGKAQKINAEEMFAHYQLPSKSSTSIWRRLRRALGR